MANIKSNEKSLRQNNKIRLKHRGEKTQLKNQIKKTKETKTVDDLSKTYSLADKLARKGTISKNKARRIKSKNANNLKTK